MKLKILSFLIAFLINLSYSLISYGWTKSGNTYATDGSYLDVSSAASDASVGDIVTMPNGSFEWSSQLVLDKEITLTGSSNTTVVNAYSASYSALILVNLSSNSSYSTRISSLIFERKSGATGTPYNIQISGDSNFRIDHCTFNTAGGGSNDVANHIMISGYGTYGVIDSCVFYGASNQELINVKSSDQTWVEPSNLGTSDFVFVEDNYFEGGNHALTSVYGARVVFRYNEVHSTDYDAHGHCFENGHNGTRVYEIYNNKFYCENSWIYGIQLRGGTGVIYDNKFYIGGTGGYLGDKPVMLTEYRVATDCTNGGCCPSASGGEGYPCYDQIGRGKDQGSEPLYIWNNDYDSNGDGVLDTQDVVHIHQQGSNCGGAQTADYIQSVAHDGESNPDYILSQKPGYTPYQYPHPLRGKQLSLTSGSHSLSIGSGSKSLTINQ